MENNYTFISTSLFRDEWKCSFCGYSVLRSIHFVMEMVSGRFARWPIRPKTFRPISESIRPKKKSIRPDQESIRPD